MAGGGEKEVRGEATAGRVGMKWLRLTQPV